MFIRFRRVRKGVINPLIRVHSIPHVIRKDVAIDAFQVIEVDSIFVVGGVTLFRLAVEKRVRGGSYVFHVGVYCSVECEGPVFGV